MEENYPAASRNGQKRPVAREPSRRKHAAFSTECQYSTVQLIHDVSSLWETDGVHCTPSIHRMHSDRGENHERDTYNTVTKPYPV